MKKLILLFIPIILFACKQETSVVDFISNDEKVALTFSGTKSSPLDPWLVSINVRGYEYDETVSVEIYNSSLDGKTILVDWINNNEAKITLIQSDNNNKTMYLQIKEGHIKLQ